MNIYLVYSGSTYLYDLEAVLRDEGAAVDVARARAKELEYADCWVIGVAVDSNPLAEWPVWDSRDDNTDLEAWQ